ncbi:MAG: Nif3-like dinuclear metal center hexameric protein [Deltaproteobacteria bacterium]|nr:MAG: Nif3-like dinuclear metal center hexameric protein [Deltaproteobacteria bacterium]
MQAVVPKLKDLLDILNELAPANLAESWDNPGLQVGFLDQKIDKVVLSLDPTTQAVRYALSQDAQALVTHHPLIFKPISSIRNGEYPGSVVYEAIKGGLSIVAMHTNLDAAHEGINTILAGLLALEDVEPLREHGGEDGSRSDNASGRSNTKAGIGRIGTLSSPVPLLEFISRVKRLLGLKAVKIVNKKDRSVRRVAVVGGSGGSLISEAWKKGADLLITGDVTYHQAREAEFLGLVVVDGGHFATERVAFRVFGKQLQAEVRDRGWKVNIIFNEREEDPLVSL